jgi:hypothetical protein
VYYQVSRQVSFLVECFAAAVKGARYNCFFAVLLFNVLLQSRLILRTKRGALLTRKYRRGFGVRLHVSDQVTLLSTYFCTLRTLKLWELTSIVHRLDVTGQVTLLCAPVITLRTRVGFRTGMGPLVHHKVSRRFAHQVAGLAGHDLRHRRKKD